MFQRGEDGDLMVGQHFGDVNQSDKEEVVAMVKRLTQNISNTFGDIGNLSLEGVTIDQIRQAFGGLEQDFNYYDLVFLRYNLIPAYNDDATSLSNIRKMWITLRSDCADRLTNEAKRLLDSEKLTESEIMLIAKQIDMAIMPGEKYNPDIAMLALKCVKSHPEIILNEDIDTDNWLVRVTAEGEMKQEGSEFIANMLCDGHADLSCTNKDFQKAILEVSDLGKISKTYLSVVLKYKNDPKFLDGILKTGKSLDFTKMDYDSLVIPDCDHGYGDILKGLEAIIEEDVGTNPERLNEYLEASSTFFTPSLIHPGDNLLYELDIDDYPNGLALNELYIRSTQGSNCGWNSYPVMACKTDAIFKKGIEYFEQRNGDKYTEKLTRLLTLYKEQNRKYTSIKMNLNMFFELESEIPEITKFLEEKLGIIDFGRYPKQLLLDQYLLKDDVDSPYGILVFPRKDHVNGTGICEDAFHSHPIVLERFYEQLKALGYNLRICEISGKLGYAKNLLRFAKHYGQKQKISFAIFGGHGSKDLIEFGNRVDYEEHRLRTDDLGGGGIQRGLSGEFYDEQPTVVLLSCLTGAEDGIAQNISGITHGTVIAPSIATYPNNIEVIRKDDKKLQFKVGYQSGKGDVAVRYFDGKKVSNK